MRRVVLAGMCLMVGSCGGAPAPALPAPFYTQMAGDVALGLRVLPESQVRTLRDVVVSAGEPCSAIDRTYLQEIEAEFFGERWNVRCPEASYAVELPGAGGEPEVSSCAPSLTQLPCFELSWPGWRTGPRTGRPGRLDPSLKELLEPMSQD